nr:MAG TPA: CDK-activating kinase assembly factor MAT1 [Caudoviricetes sp.]
MKIINDKVAKDMIDIMDDLNILYDVEVRKMLALITVQAYKRKLEDAKTLKRYNDILSDFRNMLVEVIENEMEKGKSM